jgi:phytol kinase
MLRNNLFAVITTLAAAILWLRINDFAAQRGWVSSQVSRKIIHMGTGPLFVLCWPLFTSSPTSRYLAALVPLAITTQFVLVGAGIIQDEAAVRAMSRTGDRREILKGPLFYGLIFVILTILYWTEAPTGVIALMLMCGGDGLADVIGRKFGKIKLPFNKEKSWAGSLAMFIGGWIWAASILAAYIALKVFPGTWAAYLAPLTLIAAAGTVIESLPLHDVDNISVTLTASFLGQILF